MYSKRAEFTSGLVILAAIAVFLWFLYVATGRGFFETYSHWHVRFQQGDSAPETGDEVVYLGLVVGRVFAVTQQSETRSGERLTAEDRARLATLPPGAPREVREVFVVADLEMPAAQRLPRGTTARLVKSLVTGRPTLYLMPGISGDDLTPEETRRTPILGSQGASLDDIAAKVDTLVAQVTLATKDVGLVVAEAKGFLQDLRAKIAEVDTRAMNDNVLAATASLKRTLATAEGEVDGIAANVRKATEDLSTLAGTGAEAMAAAKRDLAEILASLKSAAAKVDEVVQAGAPRVDRFLADLDPLAQQLTVLAKDLQGLGPEARRVLANLGGDLDAIGANLEDASRNLLDATEDVRANPWKLTTKPDGSQVAFENLKAASLTYVRAMTRMERAAADLKTLLARPDVSDPAIKQLVEGGLASFAKAREEHDAAARRFADLLEKASPKAAR